MTSKNSHPILPPPKSNVLSINSLVATYKKTHAHVIILSDQGDSMMWPEGRKPKRFDWKKWTVITPKEIRSSAKLYAAELRRQGLTPQMEEVSMANCFWGSIT